MKLLLSLLACLLTAAPAAEVKTVDAETMESHVRAWGRQILRANPQKDERFAVIRNADGTFFLVTREARASAFKSAGDISVDKYGSRVTVYGDGVVPMSEGTAILSKELVQTHFNAAVTVAGTVWTITRRGEEVVVSRGDKGDTYTCAREICVPEVAREFEAYREAAREAFGSY